MKLESKEILVSRGQRVKRAYKEKLVLREKLELMVQGEDRVNKVPLVLLVKQVWQVKLDHRERLVQGDNKATLV